MAQEENFFSRWSQRKVRLARDGAAAVPAEVPAQVAVQAPAALQQGGQSGTHAKTLADPQAEAQSEAQAAPPPPTLEEARSLTPASDYRRFVARDVDPEVKNAALKNLFSDPQFNVMDGLDIYIDDYGKPDPLPPGMLQRMAQAVFLGLVQPPAAAPESSGPADGAAEHRPAAQAVSEAAPEPAAELRSDTAATTPLHSTLPAPLDPPSDEDSDLRLQRHHEAGRPGAGEGPGPDPGRQR